MSNNTDPIAHVTPVPADKLPASVIMEQLGYRTRGLVQKKETKPVQRTIAPHLTKESLAKNFATISRFDTFWSSVRQVTGLHTVKRNSRTKRSKSGPINGRTAPVGSMFRGAKNADAVHLFALLGKETR